MNAPDQSLFRPEAITRLAERHLGKAELTQPLPIRHAIILLTGLVVFLIALLSFASYEPRERVTGFLEPVDGLTEITAPHGGLITTVLAKEGQDVEAGIPLFRLSASARLPDGTGLADSRRHLVSARERNLEERLRLLEDVHQRDARSIDREHESLQTEQRSVRHRLQLAVRHVAIASDRHASIRKLAESGHLAHAALHESSASLLARQAQLAELRQLDAQVGRQIDTLNNRRQQLPVRHRLARDEIESDLIRLQDEELQLQLEAETLITAPRDGTLTRITVIDGNRVGNGRILATLVPRGSPLQAVLLVPDRAVANVASGSTLRLRINALPHTRHGTMAAVVNEVTRSPGDHLRFEGQQPAPVFLARASLSTDETGMLAQLRPGMTFSADVTGSQVRLITWVTRTLGAW